MKVPSYHYSYLKEFFKKSKLDGSGTYRMLKKIKKSRDHDFEAYVNQRGETTFEVLLACMIDLSKQRATYNPFREKPCDRREQYVTPIVLPTTIRYFALANTHLYGPYVARDTAVKVHERCTSGSNEYGLVCHCCGIDHNVSA